MSYLLLAGISLPPTQKLYRQDSQLFEAQATVLYTTEDCVVLDQTPLFAEAGGQVSDAGTIDGVPVLDVQNYSGTPCFISRPDIKVPMVKVGTTVSHRVAEPSAFSAGQTVTVRVDSERRKKISAMHSAAHFAYVAINKLYGSDEPIVTGCRIDEDGFRFDFMPRLGPEFVNEAGDYANELIALGDDIQIEVEPQAPSEVFYWKYRDIVIPCGGTHVATATDLSNVTLKWRSKGANYSRFYGELKSKEN